MEIFLSYDIVSGSDNEPCITVDKPLVYYIENSKLCFLDMKIMSQRNSGDSVNNESV